MSLIALGMYSAAGAGLLGGEIAGVVLEAGPGVTGLAPGDRVMGMAGRRVRPGRGDRRAALVKIPAGWSFAQAAAVPVVFTTAWYGLVDLARVRPGQRLLVHAAAGGVGMAAVAIARHLGAGGVRHGEPGQARGAGAPWAWTPAHIASSRDAGFEASSGPGGAGWMWC